MRREDASIPIGILYPQDWDRRDPGEVEEDLGALRALDPRLELLVVAYEESDEERRRRGVGDRVDGADRRRLTPEQREALSVIEIALTMDLPSDVCSLAPRLRWVQGIGSGVSHLWSAGLADGGVRLTSATGVNAIGVAEFALGRLLEFWKRFREIDALQARRAWEPAHGRELAGSTVGLLGLGAIGSALAQRLEVLGVDVLACRKRWEPGTDAPHVDRVYPARELHSMLARCDAVVAAVPEHEDTIGLMDAEAFAAMKPGSFFCNVGRGSLVIEEALLEALETGHLGGAAVDVTRVEPLPASSPLWDAPNLTVSPHSASVVDEYFGRVHALFRENVARYLCDEPLRNEQRRPAAPPSDGTATA